MISWEGKKVWHWKIVHWKSIKWGTFLLKNHAENVHQKLAPGPFFILVNNPKQILLKIRYLERGLSKTLQKVNFIFSFKPIPFNVQSYQKQKGPGTSDQSLFRLPNKFTKIYLLVIYYLTKFDGVLYSGFWLIPKITPANLCKPIHDIIYYSSSICEEPKEKNHKKLNISRTKRAF